MDWDDLECRALREESHHQAGIGRCSLALQMGFFFDGRQRNMNVDEDNQRLTNVGRLFRAHPSDIEASHKSSYVYGKTYTPGLGTPLNDSPACVSDQRFRLMFRCQSCATFARIKDCSTESIRNQTAPSLAASRRAMVDFPVLGSPPKINNIRINLINKA